MPLSPLDRDLQLFAVELFERAGGAADWPEPELPGTAVVPREVALAAQLPGDEFTLDRTAAPGTLQVGLAGEFLEAAGRVLAAAIPREGAFVIRERHLTSRELGDKIDQAFGWQNARAKYRTAEPALVEYQLWTLWATLRSEDLWENLIRLGVNAESGAVVDLPNVFHEPDLIGESRPSLTGEPASYPTVLTEAKRRLQTASADFVQRTEQRLERDRKRIQSYYRALSREAGGSKRKTATPLTPEEIEARKRAVELELRRKLAELQENVALRAELRPVTLARVHLPALVAPVTIQRKQAFREYKLYWNSLLRKFEPLACSRCRRATYTATFTNDTVDLLCAVCAPVI